MYFTLGSFWHHFVIQHLTKLWKIINVLALVLQFPTKNKFLLHIWSAKKVLLLQIAETLHLLVMFGYCIILLQPHCIHCGNKSPQWQSLKPNNNPNPLPCRCHRRPLQRSKCEASRRPQQQTRAPPWPNCSALTTCARRPTTCRSPTWTCTSATTSTARTKAGDASRTMLITYLECSQQLMILNLNNTHCLSLQWSIRG